jgi:hypothetical protein
MISNLIALIVVWVCGIFVNMLWVYMYVINDNMYGFVFALLTCYGLMGIDFSVNMSWVCDCGVCLVFMWVCRLMENISSSGGFGTSMPDGNTPLWAYVIKIEKSSGRGGNMSFKCNYYQEIYKGSYYRVKAHLLRIVNVGIKGCPKVTAEHKLEMQKLQDAAGQKKISKESTIILPPGDGSESISSNMFGARKRKLTGKSPLERAFNNGYKEHLTSLIARMFYSGGIPFHFARNPHYVNSYKYAANNMITGYVSLGYNALRTTF